jgi:transposase-like protein
MNVKTRLGWVRLYEQLGDFGLVCRRCGISRPTLRKWWRRYQAHGVNGLNEESRRPHHLAKRKILADQEALILDLRRSRRFGIKQLRSEFLRQHGLSLSLDTLHRVLVRYGEQHLKRPKLKRKGEKRYSRPATGCRSTSVRSPQLPISTRQSTTARDTGFSASTRAGRPPTR